MPQAENRSLTAEELERLASVLPDARARLIVSLMHGEGLRRAEVATVRADDVDLDADVIHGRGKG